MTLGWPDACPYFRHSAQRMRITTQCSEVKSVRWQGTIWTSRARACGAVFRAVTSDHYRDNNPIRENS